MILDEYQENVVTSPLGEDALVLAPPGSGKTRVLCGRIDYLVEQGIDPKRILAITFTKRAARELEDRIEGSVRATTFHSLAFREIVRTRKNMSVFTDRDVATLVGTIPELLKEIPGSGPPHSRIREAISNSNRTSLREGIITPLRRTILHELKKNNALDFTGLLEELERILSSRDIPPFDYLLLDELNDVNRMQLKIANLLTKRMMAVGDIFQQIYLFQAADEGILDELRRIRTPVEYSLRINYRSPKSIISFCKKIVRGREKENVVEYTPSPTRLTDSPVKLLYVPIKEQNQSILGLVRSLIASRTVSEDTEEIVILTRTNSQVMLLASYLERNGIMVNTPGRITLFDRPEIRPIISMLKRILNPSDAASLRSFVIFGSNGIGKKRYTQPSAEELLGELTVGNIEDILKKNGYWKRIHSMENPDERVSRAREFLEIFRGAQDPHEFVNSVSLGEGDNSGKRILVSTVHKEKGLEHKIVIVSNVYYGSFPNPRGDPKEERRIFYVACSRAKEKLYLICSNPMSPHLPMDLSDTLTYRSWELPWKITGT